MNRNRNYMNELVEGNVYICVATNDGNVRGNVMFRPHVGN